MAIRTQVTFRTDQFSISELIPSAEEYDQPYGGDAAFWLIEQLPLHGFQAGAEPCQEDWGWVVFASKDKMCFWLGMSPLFGHDDPSLWIIHIHHGDFRIVQRFTKSGRDTLRELSLSLHQILQDCPAITDIRWHYDKDILKNDFNSSVAEPGSS